MPTRTVHTLAYKLITDSKEFTKGQTLSRKELTKSNKLMRESLTPAQKLEDEISHLNKLFQSGAINQQAYNKQLDKLNANYKAAQKGASRFGKIQKGIGATLLNVKSLMAVLAGAAAVRGVKRQIDDMDKIAKTAKRIGITTEFLTRLQFASAQATGMSAEQTAKALEAMTVELSKAEFATGRAKIILDKYGISVTSLVKSRPQDTLMAVRDALNSIQDIQERNVVSGAIFGKDASGFHNLLSESTDKITKLFQQSDELGNTLSSFDAGQVEHAADAIGEMSTAFSGFAKTFTQSAAPAITEVLRSITSVLDRLQGSSRRSQTARNLMNVPAALVGNIDEKLEHLEKGNIGQAINPLTLLDSLDRIGRNQRDRDRDLKRIAESNERQERSNKPPTQPPRLE